MKKYANTIEETRKIVLSICLDSFKFQYKQKQRSLLQI